MWNLLGQVTNRFYVHTKVASDTLTVLKIAAY